MKPILLNIQHITMMSTTNYEKKLIKLLLKIILRRVNLLD